MIERRKCCIYCIEPSAYTWEITTSVSNRIGFYLLLIAQLTYENNYTNYYYNY